jgi:hypothetical protein
VKHEPALIEAISRATGMNPRAVKRGLNELTRAGYLAHDAHGYFAVMKAEPPADQAEGSLVSDSLAPIGDPARHGGQDVE